MPNSIHPVNRVIASAAGLVALFFAMAYTIPIDFFIVLLNGVFVGSMAAVTIAYWPLVKNAVLGVRPYDRVRQMTVGFALCWAAYIMSVSVSVYFRSADMTVQPTLFTAAGRYAAIVAAILQVTAPDFGLGLFHGRDRKVLYTGIGVGLMVALCVIVMQESSALAEQMQNVQSVYQPVLKPDEVEQNF